MKEKKIKVWAVLSTYPKRIKHPKVPELVEAQIEYDYGCGCGSSSTSALGIYPTEQSARTAVNTRTWGGEVQIVVPATITYSMPKPN